MFTYRGMFTNIKDFGIEWDRFDSVYNHAFLPISGIGYSKYLHMLCRFVNIIMYSKINELKYITTLLKLIKT